MVDTDWREILSFSQRELMQADKEKLCESLSWMEADDIELNFTDLKTLFRLAQDILKFKSEQVNSLLGQLETSQRKSVKSKSKGSYIESPTRSTDTMLDAITHQEEVIKANKEILEQLYADIAELEGRKNILEEDSHNVDKDSESSRDALSEMEAVAQLENEVTMKNRHIRKLLGDVKILEEENTKLKDKVSVLKDKLTEATQLIENLTEQLYNINSESTQLKDILGKSEKEKAQLSFEIESLRKELIEKDSNRENIYEEIKSKAQHWKNIAKSKKTEIEALSTENLRLKEDLIRASEQSSSPKLKHNQPEEIKIQELQEKLSEASNEIMQSANIIEILQAENNKLKSIIQETPDHSMSDIKNESDDGKERTMIIKLKRKIRTLTAALQGAEEMVSLREKELTELTSQLQLLKSDEGINALLEGLKNKKRRLKFQDEGIKSLVQDVNNLNQLVNDLQLENEAMRQKLDIPMNKKISTTGILKKYRETEQSNSLISKALRNTENKLVTVEIYNRKINNTISKLTKMLLEMGCSPDRIDEIYQSSDSDDVMPADGGGESSTILTKQARYKNENKIENTNKENKVDAKVEAIIEENEGLRKGLQEILEFLKDNSTTSSGILALQCPSLEAILQSMEARHAAGWFAPHMAAVMELRAAIGGKDALLTALHEARKETFDVMTQLSKESQKSLELEQKLYEMESTNKKTNKLDDNETSTTKVSVGEFGTWMSEKEQNIDIHDRNQIENLISKRNFLHEDQLKNSLMYFHNKFKSLFEKMSSIAIQAADDQNKWSIQEEQYKAQIENLKAKLCHNEDEDASDISPGIVNLPSISFLQRKCFYLEESYKYIRTLNENMKSEYLESKKDAMLVAADYENQIQTLIIAVANLTDKLRNSISVELFWKQNEMLNEITVKYRTVLDAGIRKQNDIDLCKRLERDKIDIISTLSNELQNEANGDCDKVSGILSNIEQTILTKQLHQVCSELENKLKHIENIETKYVELQKSQSKLIDDTIASTTKEDSDLMKEQLEKLVEENKILKEQCQHIEGQLDIALLQLQHNQQHQLGNDMEINMLRHQILDLQSTGDNKAIMARLGGEVLVAHLQASESHKKIERLNSALNKEKILKTEAEEMLRARLKIFDVYAFRYECKFRYMYEVMHVLRQQYQGSLPLTSVESYLNSIEDLSRNTHEVNDKLGELEDLRSSLMAKHSVFNQILDVSKTKCLEDEDSCPHKLQSIVTRSIHLRELDHYKKKIDVLEQSREDILKRCNHLEKTLVLVNQGFERSSLDDVLERRNSDANNAVPTLELEDVQSDDEPSAKRSQTVTLPKPQILKPPKNDSDMTKSRKEDSTDNLVGSPIRVPKHNQTPEVVSVFVQTSNIDTQKRNKLIQTQEDQRLNELKNTIDSVKKEIDKKNKELAESMQLAQERTEETIALNKDKINLHSTIHSLKESHFLKDKTIERLRSSVEDLRKQIDDSRHDQFEERIKSRNAANEDNNSLLHALQELENEKNTIIGEYKDLLNNEREQFSISVKDLQIKIMELHTQLDRKGSHSSTSSADADVVNKYTLKIAKLEDKCFKMQSELDGCKAELTSYQSEVDRWKNLASERLTKMEQLNTQLEERHSHEVESYKAENEHWISQLNETQREHMELRSRLTEQKALYVKQLSDKDAMIEQLRSVVHGLKTQIMNMQTMISVTDPSFDLSAIVEVDEASDALSQLGYDRLELKFDSTVDLHDMHDDTRMSATSTAIWQEPVIERLRREKQLTGKQNAILRRQIKALAARERRARLDAQNLKNQIYRISTSGSKAATAETVSLHNKIATLQAQLTSARRDTQSTVALWDKWKRAQQTADRWQARYEEKCQEERKAESSLNMAKSAIARLEKEKRVLLSRLTEAKNDKLIVFEKQDGERAEKSMTQSECACLGSDAQAPPVSARALIDRVQAQQRRIVALEVAEKGNEYLVSEYEKALAEITSLKGQVLKLESTLLEAEIQVPLKTRQDHKSDIDYWKNYCEMLKEENVQLTLKVNSMETAPTTVHQHRVNDLEQTVLTLRGLVSKLQAEQKSSVVHKRPDSRPSSGRSGTEKGRNQLESYRTEIANLKRSILDKDLLLERSKEMLKIAAEREDHLLKENASLRHRVDELTKTRGGFLSA